MKKVKFNSVEEALAFSGRLWTPKNHKDFTEVVGQEQTKRFFYRLYTQGSK